MNTVPRTSHTKQTKPFHLHPYFSNRRIFTKEFINFFFEVTLCSGTHSRFCPDDAQWELFFALCERHRVQGFAFRNLKKAGLLTHAPSSLVQHYEQQRRCIISANEILIARTVEIHDYLREAGIAHCFVKGPVLLTESYYDALDLRTSSDIDIAVDEHQFTLLVERLVDLGYSITQPLDVRGTAMMSPRRGGPHLDLHTRFCEWAYPRTKITAFPFGDLVPVELPSGRSITTLPPEIHLLHLVAHGGIKHLFRQGYLLNDVIITLERHPELSLNSFCAMARDLGIGAAAKTALLWAAKVSKVCLSKKQQRFIDKLDNSSLRLTGRIVYPIRRVVQSHDYAKGTMRSIYRRLLCSQPFNRRTLPS